MSSAITRGRFLPCVATAAAAVDTAVATADVAAVVSRVHEPSMNLADCLCTAFRAPAGRIDATYRDTRVRFNASWTARATIKGNMIVSESGLYQATCHSYCYSMGPSLKECNATLRWSLVRW